MARTAHGFQLRWRGAERGWYVRYRLNGKRHESPTGVKPRREKGRAEGAAREIYARAVRGERASHQPSSEGLVEVTSQWLDSLAVRPVTKQLYEKYAAYWVTRWALLGDITEPALSVYVRERLRSVKGKSVLNEASALNRMLVWCVEAGLLETSPRVPRPDKASGTKYKRRTRAAAPEYTPEEIWSVIAAMPERSTKGGWPIRARAIVAYTTTLRPTTLALLRVPEHYSRGAKTLRISDEIDKESHGREIPLPAPAREALESVCPEVGQIFGNHRIEEYARAAAQAALPPSKAAIFTFQHFRSAGITHSLERTNNLVGAQYMAGHKHSTTTSKYVRSSFRAAQEVASDWGPIQGPRSEEARKRA